MAFIELADVHVDFPIYDAKGQSLKANVLRLGAGGLIGSGNDGVVRVDALRGLSLSLGHQERLGLVGHNGAGKSTLLRLLGGVYEPRYGRVTIDGRVSSLFDSTLGMDPESTGRENIFLRGIHLGLSPRQIRRQVADIAEFSELGRFIDLPLRTYSSGMQMRLAFAVSTAFEPDILLIDEGIGTGDAAFIEKAERRLTEFVGKAGILVLASHSETLLRQFCTRAVLMELGRIVGDGPVDDILDLYSRRRSSVDSS
jgi:ABC-2 type transport system ATP-binding protein/lipopolysaccharide transport system ATP-binding protein